MESIQSTDKRKRILFTLPELIFIGFMSALNVGFDLLLSPVLILLLGHIIAGILIMVPINFIFITLTKHLVDKFGTILLFMLIFSSLSIPTTFFGAIPGAYKLIVGLVVGILLDFGYIIKKPAILRIIIGGLVGPILWWLGTFLLWTAFGFPFITGMSNFLNEFIDVTRFISIPITQVNGDFFLFTLLCGGFSSIQCTLVTGLTYPISNTIKKTAIFHRFKAYQ